MNYQTKYRSNPNKVLAQNLIEYVDGDGMTFAPTGVESSQRQLDGFRDFAAKSEMMRFHTVSFSEDHSVDELLDGVRQIVHEELDGEIEIGIHVSNQGNNHIHLAQAGDYSELYMDRDDIKRVRVALADQFDESIGNKP